MRRGLPTHELRNCTPGDDAGRKKCVNMSTPVENSAFRRSQIPVITKNQLLVGAQSNNLRDFITNQWTLMPETSPILDSSSAPVRLWT
jgi:hypothetical protein